MDYLEQLKALKEKRGLTHAEISELSDIPLTTVTRIFSGATPNPTFETIARITIALGGSLDVIAGIRSANEKPLSSPVEKTITSYAELLKEKDERIKDKEAERAAERKEKYKLAIVLACVIGFLLLILTIDILNGHFGYFRY